MLDKSLTDENVKVNDGRQHILRTLNVKCEQWMMGTK
jgi:hypothetical protein